MGILSKLLHTEREETIGAPVQGRVIPITDVEDETFSQEILGKGVGIIPESEEILAPADGTLNMIFETGHAFTMTTEGGAELLVHIGIDTVNLKGQHFEPLIQAGAVIKKGTAIIHSDIKALESDGYNSTVMLIVCNSDEFGSIGVVKEGTVAAGEKIITILKK